jgi:hypothetical protein
MPFVAKPSPAPHLHLVGPCAGVKHPGPLGSRLVRWKERAIRLSPILGLATAAALLLGGVAAAASLGASTGGLGAGSKVIASCGTGMTFSYTATSYGGKRSYALNGIDLTNIPAGCLNKNLSATFYDSSGNPVGEAIRDTLPASGTTQSMSINPSANTIDTTAVAGVSIIVS